MDALLSALLACLLCEIGGANQMLALALAQRFERDGLLIAGIACAAVANAALSAAGGWYVSMLMTGDARSLCLALSLLFGGAGLFFTPKRPDVLEGWRLGVFLTGLLGSFILGFGDASQFIVFGVAARTADPVMATLGGALGVTIACGAVVLLRQPLMTGRATVLVRRIGGAILLLSGAVLGLTATQLL